MSGTYTGAVDWHEELTVIEDGDDAIGETFATPDRQVFDNTIALRDEMQEHLLRRAVVFRTTLGSGNITDSTFGSETSKLIYAAEIEVCGGGEGGNNGGVATGGRGGVSGGYQRRWVTFSPPLATITWPCYVGAGGAADEGEGEASWLDMGDHGLCIGRGGDGDSSGLAEASLASITVNGNTVRPPSAPLSEYPPDAGWGCVRSGVGGSADAGTRGGTGHCYAGEGGAAGSAGLSGRGYGAGGGGGCQSSGTTAGGGGGGGGWFDSSVTRTTASGSTAAAGKQGAIKVTFLYADVSENF
jgi:hypothetical protein